MTALLRAVKNIRQEEIDCISVCVRLAPLLLDASTVSRDNLACERRVIALLYVSMDDMGKLVQGDKKELQPKWVRPGSAVPPSSRHAACRSAAFSGGACSSGTSLSRVPAAHS